MFLFITGKRGSGKSWTAGVMMEEFHRLGLQFVCFDALNAHGGMDSLPRVESLKPEVGQSIDMKSLVDRLKTTDKSLVISLGGLPLQKLTRTYRLLQKYLIEEHASAKVFTQLLKSVRILFLKWADLFLLTQS